MKPREWSVFDAQGRIVGSIRGPRTEQEAEQAYGVSGDTKAILGGYSSTTHYVDVELGAVKRRPALPVPETKTLAPDEDWTPSPIPNGTIVRLDDTVQSEPTHAGLILNFPEPGVYRVQLNPPFPWVPAVCMVTVEPRT